MQIHHVSTTPSPNSSGVLWRFAEEFHSIPYSDIKLADQEREERPDGTNIEPIFGDSSLSDLENNNNVQSAENNSLENPWRMGVRAFQALPFTGTLVCSKILFVEGTPLDFLNLMMAEEMMESTTCMYLSLYLSLSPSLHPFLSLPPSNLSLSLSLSACLSLSLSLSLSLLVSYLGNKPTETYSESKKTHVSVTLAGACEVINSPGG